MSVVAFAACALLAGCGKRPEFATPVAPPPKLESFPVAGTWDVQIEPHTTVLLQIEDDHGALSGTLHYVGDLPPPQVHFFTDADWPLKGSRTATTVEFICEGPGARAVFTGNFDVLGNMRGDVSQYSKSSFTAPKWRWQAMRRGIVQPALPGATPK